MSEYPRTPRAKPKLTRAKADVLVRDLLDRVACINTSADYAYTITAVVVFGSYLTDAPKIGDLDVAVGLERRSMDDAEQARLEQRAYNAATGSQLMTVFAQAAWPKIFVFRAIRHRHLGISLHELSDLEAFYRHGTRVSYRVLVGSWTPPGPE